MSSRKRPLPYDPYEVLNVYDPTKMTDRQKEAIDKAQLFLVSFKCGYCSETYVIGTEKDISSLMAETEPPEVTKTKSEFKSNNAELLLHINEYVHLANKPIPMDYQAYICACNGAKTTFRYAAYKADTASLAFKAASEVLKQMAEPGATQMKIDLFRFPKGKWSLNACTPPN